MASSSKKKTTFAKLNRENKLRTRRLEKEARKQARKQEAASQRDAAADASPETADDAAAWVDDATASDPGHASGSRE
jgi:hypothetical protein